MIWAISEISDGFHSDQPGFSCSSNGNVHECSSTTVEHRHRARFRSKRNCLSSSLHRCSVEEFRTAAPFHRLQPSQRSVSETALNNPKGVSNLAGAHSGSMSALPDHRRDTDFGSRYSLPADTGASRDDRKGHRAGGGSFRNGSPVQDRTNRLGPAANKGKGAKGNVAESITSDSSDSD